MQLLFIILYAFCFQMRLFNGNFFFTGKKRTKKHISNFPYIKINITNLIKHFQQFKIDDYYTT